jgi:predicted nucleic acid-binding Zn ribbon protein
MRVNPRDGRCRECDGQLEIVDALDDVLTVRCESCGGNYDAETDAFHDGGMTYYVDFLAEQMKCRDDAT